MHTYIKINKHINIYIYIYICTHIHRERETGLAPELLSRVADAYTIPVFTRVQARLETKSLLEDRVCFCF